MSFVRQPMKHALAVIVIFTEPVLYCQHRINNGTAPLFGNGPIRAKLPMFRRIRQKPVGIIAAV